MAPTRRTPGSSNESAKETLDPSQDLAAANAEIERLRALLAAKDTPAPSSETLSYDRLADVLEMLSQRLARADSPAAPSKSAKIPDPPILTDRKDPTFDN